MILANGTKVFLIGGHYLEDTSGCIGTILAHRNSSRDGDSYIIDFEGFVGKVQVKAKFVSALNKTNKNSKHPLEGKWMLAPLGIEVFEESEDDSNIYSLKKCQSKKLVLVTLVYNDYDTLVANVAFQGEYAVVPVNSLQFPTYEKAGKNSQC